MNDKKPGPDIIKWLEGEARKLNNLGGADPYDLYGDARETAGRIRKVIGIIEAARELESFVWGNPGYPQGGELHYDRLHANAKRRQELAAKVFDAIAESERVPS